MVKVTDHATWQELVVKKDSHNRSVGKSYEWRGYVKVDGSGRSQKEINQLVEEAGERYKADFAREAESRGGGLHSIPKDVVHSLQDAFARELRTICGVNENDARPLTADKRLDIIKLAKLFEISPGDDGWEDDIVRLVSQDKHIATDIELED